MVIVGHMSSKSAFGAKNTGQKFLTPKNFWWCRNVCHDSCPGVIFGAGRGRVENFRGWGGPGQPFPPGPGQGRAGRASLVETLSIVGPVKPEIIKMWAARSIFHRIWSEIMKQIVPCAFLDIRWNKEVKDIGAGVCVMYTNLYFYNISGQETNAEQEKRKYFLISMLLCVTQ